uniref:Mitochondrial ribosomal protein L20 n=1 Tax=Canis lupus dingo TaxID=286419 RepID=A0A8C0QZ42_CANLU
MVFLTAQLWLRSRLTDRYWRVQKVLQHARHFRGRKNRCYKLAVRAVTRAFVKCTKARRLKKRNMRTVSADPGAGLPLPLCRLLLTLSAPISGWRPHPPHYCRLPHPNPRQFLPAPRLAPRGSRLQAHWVPETVSGHFPSPTCCRSSLGFPGASARSLACFLTCSSHLAFLLRARVTPHLPVAHLPHWGWG